MAFGVFWVSQNDELPKRPEQLRCHVNFDLTAACASQSI